MPKQKPQRSRRTPEAKSPRSTFTEIGGSPVPGLTLRHILRGHPDFIGRIAWSPDGSYLASPSDDGTVRIWDVRSGVCVRTFQGHTDDVISTAWSPDGQCLASASIDKLIHLWKASSGQHLRTLEGHTDWIKSVAWSPDSLRLASGSNDKTIRVWHAASGKHLQTLEGTMGWGFWVAWSPDGQRIAAASGRLEDDLTESKAPIHVWDATTGKHLQALWGHTDSVVRVEWSPDGHRLVSASADKTIRLWEAASGKAMQVLEEHSDYVSCATFSPMAAGLPCTWQSEPVLKDLQALPKDGKAIIKFPVANGKRDEVWAEIAHVIEKRAMAKNQAQ